MEIKFKRLPNGVGLPLPKYATDEAAGIDICAAESKTLGAGAFSLIKTGFAVSIPKGFELQCRPRSGLAAKHGITITNSPGTIDSDYRGELMILLHNLGSSYFGVNKGDRIAQLVLSEAPQGTIIEVEELDKTVRGENGFGSTGRN